MRISDHFEDRSGPCPLKGFQNFHLVPGDLAGAGLTAGTDGADAFAELFHVTPPASPTTLRAWAEEPTYGDWSGSSTPLKLCLPAAVSSDEPRAMETLRDGRMGEFHIRPGRAFAAFAGRGFRGLRASEEL